MWHVPSTYNSLRGVSQMKNVLNYHCHIKQYFFNGHQCTCYFVIKLSNVAHGYANIISHLPRISKISWFFLTTYRKTVRFGFQEEYQYIYIYVASFLLGCTILFTPYKYHQIAREVREHWNGTTRSKHWWPWAQFGGHLSQITGLTVIFKKKQNKTKRD